MDHSHHHKTDKKEYIKFFCLILVLLLNSIIIPYLVNNKIEFMNSMRWFMGLFFLTFGSFKIFNLNDFVGMFKLYDLIAKNIPFYGYIYPYIEILLGACYLASYNLFVINIFTAVLSFVGAVGVLIEIRKDSHIQCACLGNVVKLPLSKISLSENLLMGIMAIIMLLLS